MAAITRDGVDEDKTHRRVASPAEVRPSFVD